MWELRNVSIKGIIWGIGFSLLASILLPIIVAFTFAAITDGAYENSATRKLAKRNFCIFGRTRDIIELSLDACDGPAVAEMPWQPANLRRQPYDFYRDLQAGEFPVIGVALDIFDLQLVAEVYPVGFSILLDQASLNLFQRFFECKNLVGGDHEQTSVS